MATSSPPNGDLEDAPQEGPYHDVKEDSYKECPEESLPSTSLGARVGWFNVHGYVDGLGLHI